MRALQSLFARCLALVLAVTLSIQPALAQSILRDAETEGLLHEMATPLIRAAGLDPRNVSVVLVGDMSINAFVAGGQVVYLNAGLINEAGSALEVQGVIAHELGHITGGHIINEGGAKAAQGISILSLLLGGIAAAAGSGDAAMGVIMAGQQAALGKYLAFSRGQEASADAAGAKYLSAAGLSGRGSLQFFKRLANLEMRYGFTRTPDSEFYRTHPMTMDRITTLQDTYEKDPAWNAPADPVIEARFQRVKAKLLGYLSEPKRTLQVYPETMADIPARYARTYAFHKDARLDKALAEADALLAKAPNDPYFLELKGQILLESGKPAQALPALRKATDLSGHNPLIATTFGHALIATEDPAQLAEAEKVLRAAVSLDRENPFAWYQLGVIYGARGDIPRAQLASAEQQTLQRNYQQALRSAESAQAGLTRGSADWIRAGDIAMQSRAAIEQGRKAR